MHRTSDSKSTCNEQEEKRHECGDLLWAKFKYRFSWTIHSVFCNQLRSLCGVVKHQIEDILRCTEVCTSICDSELDYSYGVPLADMQTNPGNFSSRRLIAPLKGDCILDHISWLINWMIDLFLDIDLSVQSDDIIYHMDSIPLWPNRCNVCGEKRDF